VSRRNRHDPRQLDGLLVLNKPTGPTSAACLNRIKHGLGQFKIGHAGTLDPLARGVLLVLLGQGTKIASYLTGGEKIYSGEFTLGLTSDTYDSEGKILARSEVTASPEEVAQAVEAWKDLTEQEVPAYSAAKHKGKPLYSLARAGEDVPVKSKAVTVFHAEPLEIALPTARFRVRCSAGTYVRSLVHSLGMRLGCGAIMTQLTREASLPFGLEQAHDLEAVLGEPERFAQRVIPLAEALPHWSRLRLSDTLAAQVKNGAWLPVAETEAEGRAAPGDHAVFLEPGGSPLALVEAQAKDGNLCWVILRGLWSEEAPRRDKGPGSAS
jgi:tRNA pseudouridine55 synthase